MATSLYTIGTDFRDLRSINWVALAYTLAYLGCAVAFAHISDVIGRRNAFILAYILFFTFSLASGFALNLQQLIAFRTIQGIGGSGMFLFCHRACHMLTCNRIVLSHNDNIAGNVSTQAHQVCWLIDRPGCRRIRCPWTYLGRRPHTIRSLALGILDQVSQAHYF